MTEAGSSEARLVAVAFKVAWEVNIDLAGQDLIEHCQVVFPSPDSRSGHSNDCNMLVTLL